ncbi:hypothetical protein BOTBODRAFT_155793 [Botryobasidium botryosum FD-172 SS1]|uniref:ATP-dependent DNA helicase II subunit 2 n=1 Tax=Botryobasidium botryosum (strain FD-172 SS1) TaxID=930990 RepID=A0A067MQ57_BOTB1|nr:hypothetical protein BOTBODRAFT_155793 [Botryobasidium botryosum FD-172 SS1]
MPERAGYTVTMFVIDVNSSMGQTRAVEALGPNGEPYTKEITHLEWALQFVMMKVQEMIFNGRKTDKCGVILYGTPGTKNILNDEHANEYPNVTEFIPIIQPTPSTLSKIASIRASEDSTTSGDSIDGIIVAIQTQGQFLGTKKTWTRKMVVVTDGETPMELDDWEATTQKMNELEIGTAIIGVDFDDEDSGFVEENKSRTKQINEKFFRNEFVPSLNRGIIGTCAAALQDCNLPEPKFTKSVLMQTVLRIGDTEGRPEDSIEISVKTSKCTALVRPVSLKKFGRREGIQADVETEGGMTMVNANAVVPLTRRTEYLIERGEEGGDEDGDEDEEKEKIYEKVEKEQLVKAFKYGATWVPSEEDAWEKLHTVKGIDVLQFFDASKWHREYSIGEVQFIFADPNSARAQVSLSSIVQAMYIKGAYAIVRWVSGDGRDVKMGVVAPRTEEGLDYLVSVQMPFAEDVRKYTFPSLDNLKNRLGETLTKHPNIPTDDMMSAMDAFVDSMDLTHAGDKDEEGNRLPWFTPLDSFNPAVHRVKQALFHGAITSDIAKNPLPPPHPELTKYFEPPSKVLRRSKKALEQCKQVFGARQAPPKVATKRKKVDLDATEGTDDEFSLSDLMGAGPGPSKVPKNSASQSQSGPQSQPEAMDVDSGTEDEDYVKIDMTSVPKSVKAESPKVSKISKKTPTPPPQAASPMEIDPPAQSGKLIGNAFPLKDFNKNVNAANMAQGLDELGIMIVEIVRDSFSTQRFQEAIDCMKAMRKAALEDEDGVEQWNEFLRNLKTTCRSKAFKNGDFWDHIKKVGRTLSLISEKEGAVSDISEAAAVKFMKD